MTNDHGRPMQDVPQENQRTTKTHADQLNRQCYCITLDRKYSFIFNLDNLKMGKEFSTKIQLTAELLFKNSTDNMSRILVVKAANKIYVFPL